MEVNIETAIRWMTDRVGRVKYSMNYRNGPNFFDCSRKRCHRQRLGSLGQLPY